MKELWHRLGRPDAINLIGFFGVTLLQATGSLLVAVPNSSGKEVLLLALSLCSMAPIAIILLGARYLLLQRLPECFRPLATLIVFEIACIARAIFFDLLLLSAGFIEHSMFVYRILGSQAAIFLGLIVSASLVTYAREFSERNAALSASLSALNNAYEEISIRLQARKDHLINSIRNQLTSGLTELRGVDVETDANQLKYLLDDVVRPLSYQLGRGFDSSIPEVHKVDKSQVNWTDIYSRTLTSNPIQPVWFTLWISLGAFQLFLSRGGSQIFQALITSLLTSFCLLLIFRFIWNFFPTQWGLTFRAIVFSLFPLILAVSMNSLVHVLFGIEIVTVPLLTAEVIYFEAISWIFALLSTLSDSLKTINKELVTANEDLKRQLVTENANARHFESEVSRVLHGSVQDAISSSLRKIQSLPEGSQLSSVEIESLRAPIEDSLKLLLHPEFTAQKVAGAVDDLAALWAGVVEIQTLLSSEAILELESAQISSGIAVEIIREAVSNAIRHGDASEISIALELSADGADVTITVTNNGMPVPAEYQEGIGSALMHDLAITWSRTNQAGLVVVEARVPLN